MDSTLHKGSSTNSGYYISMVNVGDIWFECDDVKITKIKFNYFCNSNTVYMLFYKRSTWWKNVRGIGLVPSVAACWVSWGEGTKTPEDLLPCIAYFHLLLLPFFLFFGLYPLLLLVLVMSLHTFTLLMTIRNALWTMRLLYSTKFFLVTEKWYSIS